MRTLPLPRHALDDPIYAQRNTYQTFLLALSILASFPLLHGDPSSALLARVLPNLTVMVWGWTLLAGSVIALVGQFWPGHTWTGLVIERAGITLVGAGAAFYAGVVWYSADGHGVAYMVAVTTAYALSCGWRTLQITRRLKWMKGLIQEIRHGGSHG